MEARTQHEKPASACVDSCLEAKFCSEHGRAVLAPVDCLVDLAAHSFTKYISKLNFLKLDLRTMHKEMNALPHRIMYQKTQTSLLRAWRGCACTGGPELLLLL
eukprot:358534-Pleurochrysis_carterae.AAC.2